MKNCLYLLVFRLLKMRFDFGKKLCLFLSFSFKRQMTTSLSFFFFFFSSLSVVILVVVFKAKTCLYLGDWYWCCCYFCSRKKKFIFLKDKLKSTNGIVSFCGLEKCFKIKKSDDFFNGKLISHLLLLLKPRGLMKHQHL